MPWIFPLLGIIVILYLSLYSTVSKNIIKITFESAQGIRSGLSKLQLNGVDVGRVRKLNSTPDLSHVVIEVEIPSRASSLFTEGARFWIDKKVPGVLDIAMEAQPQLGRAQQVFVGLESPPILKANVPGHAFILKAKRLGSIFPGSPVFFRDLNVGEVLGWDIADMAEYVTIRAFVRAPYVRYVLDETRFWFSEAVVYVGSGSGRVEVSRMPGIAFETPTAEIHRAAAPENYVFPLFADRDAANNASYTRKIPLISYFPGSVKGLAPGSEVTMHGLKVGEVTDVRLAYDPAKDTIVAPVRYEIEIERIVGVGQQRVFKPNQESVKAVLNRGLRATVESASLTSGRQAVALDFVPDAPEAPVTMEGEDFVVPTAESGGP